MSDTAIMEMESTSPNIPRRNATSAVVDICLSPPRDRRAKMIANDEAGSDI